MTTTMQRFTVMAGLVTLAACGGGGSSGDPDAPPGQPDAAGTPRTRAGTVYVSEERRIHDDGSGPMEFSGAQFFAQLYADRAASFHRETMASGACRLLEYTPATCDPACTTGLCVAPGECEPWPEQVSAGRLTLTGVTGGPLTIDPDGDYYYYSEQLPADLFADTATVTATFAGDEAPAMTIEAGGVPRLATPIGDRIVLEPGEDHVIRWTPAGAGRIRVNLNSNNPGHGLPYFGIIECEADDAAGELTIPAAIVDAFPETMAWSVCAGSDCPPSLITRYRRGAFALDGDREVVLIVESRQLFGVEHIVPE